MAQLLFANKSPSRTKTELIAVLPDGHVFTKRETMQRHIEAGGTVEDWVRNFSLVKISDKTDTELHYLLDDSIPERTVDGEVIPARARYYFIEPATESTEYQSLLNTGEVTLTFEEFSSFIGDSV